MKPQVEDVAVCWLGAPYERPAFYVQGSWGLDGVVDVLGNRPNPFIARGDMEAGTVSWS